ncbi:hypothetical protein C5167_024281, partial [Papaver somniferum]
IKNKGSKELGALKEKNAAPTPGSLPNRYGTRKRLRVNNRDTNQVEPPRNHNILSIRERTEEDLGRCSQQEEEDKGIFIEERKKKRTMNSCSTIRVRGLISSMKHILQSLDIDDQP